jgi:hypothetical protein
MTVDRTRPALGDAAAELGSGQAQRVAQYPQQRRIGLDVDGVLLPVNGEIEGHGGSRL